MKTDDLKTKCAKAMLESGPDVKIRLTVPRPEGLKDGATVIGLGLERSGGPQAVIKGWSKIDGQPMLTVHVKAASILKALEDK